MQAGSGPGMFDNGCRKKRYRMTMAKGVQRRRDTDNKGCEDKDEKIVSA